MSPFLNCRQEIVECQQKFYAQVGFPGVIGAIDGSHLRLLAPNFEEWAYVNRKGEHTINMQVRGQLAYKM